MKLIITEIRVAILDVNPNLYPENERTEEDIIRLEKHNYNTTHDYMDMLKADAEVNFKVIY